MNEFEAYLKYVALKNHFKGTQDYFKYNGAVNVTVDSYKKRNDKAFFRKLAKRHDPEGFLIANFITNTNYWVGDLDVADSNYNQWVKRTQNLRYYVLEDIKKLPDLKTALKPSKKQLPPFLQMYLNGTISIETITILIHAFSLRGYWIRHWAIMSSGKISKR